MREQLAALRRRMAEEGVNAYLIPTDDFHSSEYVSDYFKSRAYISGFTGSAGTLVVLQDWAGLWTDGRYFLQASQQLEGSGITLCKSGEKDVPTEDAFLFDHLEKGQTLAFDGRTVSARKYHALEKKLKEKEIQLRADVDFVGDIWAERPAMSANPAWELGVVYSGKTRADKLQDVRKALKEKGADSVVLSSLDDVAWTLNIRGSDVNCCAFVLSYLAIDQKTAVLFVNESVISDDLRSALAKDGVELKPYAEVYAYAAALEKGTKVWLDEDKTNSALWNAAGKNCEIIAQMNPTTIPKCTKNEVEVANEKIAHIRDGVAVTKFIFWLKQNVGKIDITERSAAEYLESLRAQQEHYMGPSFAPIVAYAHHGAIVHYSATEESDIALRAENFLLCDTGGHYLEGTTDITRTIALGPISEDMKKHYTLVLRSHLALLNAKFLHGCRGSALDMVARQPMWAEGLDYNHGTGHGVGYLLSVHEGPVNFRFRSAGQDAVLKPGMIISDEPGLYLADQYGIRLENLMVCEDDMTNDFGHFMKFAPLTMVPFDRAAIDATILSEQEKIWLNQYHAAVREALRPYLNEEETAWMYEMTAAF